MCRAAWAEPETARQKIGLKDRLEHDLHRGRHDTVTDRRNRQRTLFAHPRFGDEHPPRGQRTPPISPQVLGQLIQEPIDTVFLDFGQGGPVNAGRAVVAAHRDPRPPQDISAIDLVPQRMKPSPRIGLGRPVKRVLQGTNRIQHGPRSGGTSQIGTHRAPPSQTQRVNEAAALPSPQVVLSYGSIGTTTASDSHPAPDPLPGSTPVIGQAIPRNSQCVSAGEGLPSSRRHRLNVPRPLTPRSPSRLHFQDLHRFHGLHREPPGSALPQYLTTRQASLALRTAQLLPPTGLSTLGFDPARFQTKPPACYRAS